MEEKVDELVMTMEMKKKKEGNYIFDCVEGWVKLKLQEDSEKA
jgi:hypothetical protein